MRTMRRIERGIPPPRGVRERKPYSNIVTNWKGMAVGDSVFFDDQPAERVGAMMIQAATRHGYKFTQSAQEGGIRVWRIE